MTKQKQPVILIDMDDVLADFSTEWISRYNRDYDDNLTVEALESWSSIPALKPECGDKIFDYFTEPGIFRHLKPKQGSQEVVAELVKWGAEILVVTDSPKGCSFGAENWKGSNPADDKRAWLKEHFPMIPEGNVFICQKKWHVAGDILIDDKPGTIQMFQELNRKVIAMDMPYNRNLKVKLRAKTWGDIRKVLVNELFSHQKIETTSLKN